MGIGQIDPSVMKGQINDGIGTPHQEKPDESAYEAGSLFKLKGHSKTSIFDAI